MGWVLLFFVLSSVGGGRGKEEREFKSQCTPTQRFIKNLEEMFWHPIIHRIQFEMIPTENPSWKKEPPSTLPVFVSNSAHHHFLETPRAVFVIGLKILTGLSFPFISKDLSNDLDSLDYCDQIASVHEIETVKNGPCPFTKAQCNALERYCGRATFLSKNALANLPNALFWWFIYGVVVSTFLVGICCFWLSSSSS